MWRESSELQPNSLQKIEKYGMLEMVNRYRFVMVEKEACHENDSRVPWTGSDQ